MVRVGSHLFTRNRIMEEFGCQPGELCPARLSQPSKRQIAKLGSLDAARMVHCIAPGQPGHANGSDVCHALPAGKRPADYARFHWPGFGRPTGN